MKGKVIILLAVFMIIAMPPSVSLADDMVDESIYTDWSTFSLGFGFYEDEYSLSTDQTNYNNVSLNVIGMISVGGKQSYYSPILLPAEFFSYGKDGEASIELVYLLPIIKGGVCEVVSDDVFEVDNTLRQAWGNDGVDYFHFIDEEKLQIAYSETRQAYIGNNIVTELQSLPWPGYYSKGRRVILYPVSEEKAKTFRKYDTDTYEIPEFYALENGPFNEQVPLKKLSVLTTADTWAQNELNESIMAGLATDKMTKLNFKVETTREEFSELIMKFYFKLGGSEIEVTASPFTDTSNEEIIMANRAGIVNGVGDGSFNPEGKITREELCVMIIRALKSAGVEVDEVSNFESSFEDSDVISSWAIPSMATLNNYDIYKGSGSKLIPKQSVDKQTAVILLYRAYNLFK